MICHWLGEPLSNCFSCKHTPFHHSPSLSPYLLSVLLELFGLGQTPLNAFGELWWPHERTSTPLSTTSVLERLADASLPPRLPAPPAPLQLTLCLPCLRVWNYNNPSDRLPYETRQWIRCVQATLQSERRSVSRLPSLSLDPLLPTTIKAFSTPNSKAWNIHTRLMSTKTWELRQ